MNKGIFVEKIVNKMINCNDTEVHMNIDEWDWISGVGMYGTARAWRYTGNDAYLQYLKDWVDRHWEGVYRLKTVNHTAPFLTIFMLYEVTGEGKYLESCKQIADWLIKGAPKTKDGGLEHTVNASGQIKFPEQMWGDTLFMACIFLARMGKKTKNLQYIKEACKQLAVHHQILKDKNSGLFYHGWNCLTRDWMSGALWARANAWITASTIEMLEELPNEFDGRGQIIKSLYEQVAALKKAQRKSGMFGTLLDCPEAYDETSATAGFAYGIKRGIKNGILPAEFDEIWKKAERSVIERINDQGEVMGVSAGTPVMPTKNDYKFIPTLPTLYGQGLTLLMLCEDP